MLERELKYQINESDFMKLTKYFIKNYKKVDEYKQINYYFDTKDFELKKQEISCRVRKLDNARYEYTVKSRVKNYEMENFQVKNE